MRPIRRFCLFSLAWLAIPSCGAQVQSTAEPPSTGTVLHTTTNLVLVDVVVTDKGKAIHSLDRSRFHVFEDGREQPITSFDEHEPAASLARIAPAQSSVLPTTLPPRTYSNVPVQAESSAANVLLMDELNTPKQNWEYLRRQMIDYLATLQPGTSLAVFRLSSELRMVQGFAGDAAETLRTLQAMKPENMGTRLTDKEKLLQPDALPDGLRVETPPLQYAPVTDERPQVTLKALFQLAQYLKLIPGRKNLMWFAASFPVAFDPNGALSAAHISVYPVDARGLTSSPGSKVSYAFDLHDQAGEIASADFNEWQKAEHAAMEQFAELTGGQAYFNSNGLKEAMASAVENGSSYYTLSYVPKVKNLDGKFHTIKLRLDDAHYDLAYRRSYFAALPGQPSLADPVASSQMTESTLPGAPLATQILFQARVLPSTDPLLRTAAQPDGPVGEMAAALEGPIQHTIIDLTVDPNGITFSQTPEGVHEASVEFTLAAYDPAGKRVNYLLHDTRFHMNDKLYAQALADGVPVRLALDLPTGEFSLRIAAYDLAGLRTGSLEVPVTVAATGGRATGSSR
jgi:VWFA-related protein